MSVGRADVIEFDLGAQRYCIDTEHVSEIAEIDGVTAVPESGGHVVGVTDLRGRTTTVFDPAAALAVDAADDRRHILVLAEGADAGAGTVGWLVGAVHQVRSVSDDDVDPLRESGPGVSGVVRTDDRFVVRLDPAALVA